MIFLTVSLDPRFKDMTSIILVFKRTCLKVSMAKLLQESFTIYIFYENHDLSLKF